MTTNSAKHCLLVIDDEPDMVQSVINLLRFDYRVLGTTQVEEARQIMGREDVHMVLTDQRMPGVTGVEFLQTVKENHPEVVRLLFTAYADIEVVTEAINQGNVFRYITKPWAPTEMKAILRQAGEHYDLQAQCKRLLGEVREKNSQLETANEELLRANELKKVFIRVASHELRTPLTVILGLAELASGSSHCHPALQIWLKQICASGYRLSDRINQMVQLLLTERFERPLQRRPVDLVNMIRLAMLSVTSFIQERKQFLTLDIADNLGVLELEEEKIHDCLVQLLINAIKFTPDGGTIELSARRLTAHVIIKIADHGTGIDAASLPHVFDPFFTRFNALQHSSGTYEFDRRGLGLGLSVVRAFVEMHGGRVRVESELNRGTTFTIELPAT